MFYVQTTKAKAKADDAHGGRAIALSLAINIEELHEPRQAAEGG